MGQGAGVLEGFALFVYRTFARFIEESPLERGRTFSALLGLAEYSDCRQALQAASDSRALNTDFEINVLTMAVGAAQKAAQQALITLRTSCENVTGKPLEDIDKLNECIAEVTAALGNVELLKPHFTGKTLNDIDFDEIKTAIKTAEGGEKRRELEKTIESIAALEALAVHDLAAVGGEHQMIGALIDERDKLLASTRGDLFKRLYQSAREVISKGDWTDDEKCPLCESELPSSITGHLNEQLAQYADAAAKIAEIRDTWQVSAWQKAGSVFASPDGTTTWQHLPRDVYHLVCPKFVNRITRWVYDRNGEILLVRPQHDRRLRSMTFEPAFQRWILSVGRGGRYRSGGAHRTSGVGGHETGLPMGASTSSQVAARFAVEPRSPERRCRSGT